MRQIAIATTQMSCSWERERNIDQAAGLVREAAEKGANLIVLQELFETPYFCINKRAEHFELARTFEGNATITRFEALAKELGVVIPVSFFERDGDRYFNSLTVIDADGSNLGLYRKSHIPDFAGYEEAYYFSPGDTGFKVFETKFGRLGAAVCWDQWFPEAARAMAMQGAEILVYPTAIGSEPLYPDLNSKAHWQTTMQGHAAANLVVVAASNRIGTEVDGSDQLAFYGGSFITNHRGEKVTEASSNQQEITIARFDLNAVAEDRRNWGIFRTRRPDLYDTVTKAAPPEMYDTREV